MFAFVLEHLVFSFPTMFYWAVVPGHQGDCIRPGALGIFLSHDVLLGCRSRPSR